MKCAINSQTRPFTVIFRGYGDERNELRANVRKYARTYCNVISGCSRSLLNCIGANRH